MAKSKKKMEQDFSQKSNLEECFQSNSRSLILPILHKLNKNKTALTEFDEFEKIFPISFNKTFQSQIFSEHSIVKTPFRKIVEKDGCLNFFDMVPYEHGDLVTSAVKILDDLTVKKLKENLHFATKCVSLSPDVLKFENYIIGNKYSKLATIRNISNFPLHFQIIGIPKQLENILHAQMVNFGQLTITGQINKIKVIFTAKEDMDCNSEIWMKCEKGPFIIPVVVKKHKNVIKIFPQKLNFGQQCVGFSTTRSLTIINNSYDPVEFQIFISGEKKNKYADKSQEAELDNPPVCSKDFLLLTGVKKGKIDRFSKLQSEITFKPEVPCTININVIVKILIPEIQEIIVPVVGCSFESPLTAECTSYYLKICVFHHLYQDVIVVLNRANKMYKIYADFPKCLKNHFDILPKFGIIQAKNKFNFHVKFLPRESILTEAEEFIDSVGVLEVPITIAAIGQVLPVNVTMYAVVSDTEILFTPDVLDFQDCHLEETVKLSVQMTNASLTAQKFAFLDLPEFIDILPDHGVGTLLPKESIQLDLLFAPQRPGDYSFTLACKTIYNRIFQIKCTGRGIETSLKFSHNYIKFADTPLYSTSSAVIHLQDTSQHSKSFHGVNVFKFDLPPESPIGIFPLCGIIKNKIQKLLVTFTPQCTHNEVLTTSKDSSEQTEYYDLQEISTKENFRKSSIGSENSLHFVKISPTYLKRVQNLIEQFEEHIVIFKIPCYIGYCSSENINDLEDNFSMTSILNLQVETKILKPGLKLDENVIDFGEKIVGTRSQYSLGFQNLTENNLEVFVASLNLCGPFEIMSGKKIIPKNSRSTMKIIFEPNKADEYFEILQLGYNNHTLSVILLGKAINAQIETSIENDEISCGYVVLGENFSVPFIISNLTSHMLECSFVHDNSIDEHHQNKNWHDTLYTKNLDGSCPFSLLPSVFSIPPKEKTSISVYFAPDHEHEFHACVRLLLNNKTVLRLFTLKGTGSKYQVLLKGYDNVQTLSGPIMHSPFIDQPITHTMDNVDLPVVTLLFRGSKKNGEFIPVTKDLTIIYINSNKSVSKKQSSEFTIEFSSDIESLGFFVEPIKGTVDASTPKIINFKWIPSKKAILF